MNVDDKYGDTDDDVIDDANNSDSKQADAKTDLGHKGEKAEAAPGPTSHTLYLGLAVPAGRQSRRELHFQMRLEEARAAPGFVG